MQRAVIIVLFVLLCGTHPGAASSRKLEFGVVGSLELEPTAAPTAAATTAAAPTAAAPTAAAPTAESCTHLQKSEFDCDTHVTEDACINAACLTPWEGLPVDGPCCSCTYNSMYQTCQVPDCFQLTYTLDIAGDLSVLEPTCIDITNAIRNDGTRGTCAFGTYDDVSMTDICFDSYNPYGVGDAVEG